jgi:hypothetical protein
MIINIDNMTIMFQTNYGNGAPPSRSGDINKLNNDLTKYNNNGYAVPSVLNDMNNYGSSEDFEGSSSSSGNKNKNKKWGKSKKRKSKKDEDFINDEEYDDNGDGDGMDEGGYDNSMDDLHFFSFFEFFNLFFHYLLLFLFFYFELFSLQLASLSMIMVLLI